MARAGTPEQLVTVELVHAIPGRSRLRVREPALGGGELRQLARALSRCPGTRAATAGRRTGTLLILHRGTFTEWRREAEQHGLLHFASATHSQPPIPTLLQRQIESGDSGVRGLSGGALDLRSLTVVALLLLALIQGLRGQVLGPASGLLWYALRVAGVAAPESLLNGESALDDTPSGGE